jgi:broad specificity phosphatase PhoE
MSIDQRVPTRDQQPAPAPARAGECLLLLVRHGTTTLNVQNRYRGRRDVPLDAQGYQDAVDAARQLSSVGLTAVYTGPLRRTVATAQIIADEARVPDLRILHGLNNVDYGAWEGLTSDEAAMYSPDDFARYRTAPHLAVCPAGERLTDAQNRMVEAVELIGSRHAGETVAAVTHAVMIRLLVARLTEVKGEDWRIPVGRGSLTAISVEDRRISVVKLPEGTDVD